MESIVICLQTVEQDLVTDRNSVNSGGDNLFFQIPGSAEFSEVVKEILESEIRENNKLAFGSCAMNKEERSTVVNTDTEKMDSSTTEVNFPLTFTRARSYSDTWTTSTLLNDLPSIEEVSDEDRIATTPSSKLSRNDRNVSRTKTCNGSAPRNTCATRHVNESQRQNYSNCTTNASKLKNNSRKTNIETSKSANWKIRVNKRTIIDDDVIDKAASEKSLRRGQRRSSNCTANASKLKNNSRKTNIETNKSANWKIRVNKRTIIDDDDIDADTSGQSSRKSVRFGSNGSATSSPREVKAASVTPGLTAAITPRPPLKFRASIKLESQPSSRNEKLRLEGNAWTSHLQNVQEKKANSNSTVTGLSKAHCAFKKLLNKMEEDYVGGEQAQEAEEFRAESRGAELPGSRPASNMFRSDSRWLPLRRSSDTLPIRLNTWAMGSLEPASMDSFRENSEEEEELGLDTEHSENDDDSLHEIFILKQSS
ncbi:hypothetical protein OS493_032871 [Desmophyllum pertusum]|uniref:Uncharacterized protein n=1 Tax=Desmophyllum pertusum TaxID=174260 RepID=A0A9W9YJ73_9CNID|nr:hypothetical protein OS493_032871 [Desmophyllum pertusum]